MSSSQDAQAIRRECLALRKRCSPAETKRKSAEVIQKFLSFAPDPKIFHGLKVLFYRAIPGELNLHDLAVRLIGHGASAYFPRIIDRAEKKIEAAHIEDPETAAWSIGAYGIEEPHPDRLGVPASEIDLVFAPGVAFSLKGERLGMGAGYYDRFLLDATGALRVALCFDEQLKPALPQNAWDQPMEWIITESREVRSKKVNEWLRLRKKGG